MDWRVGGKKKTKATANQDCVTEDHAANEEKRPEEGEAPSVALFMLVQPRRDKLPSLPKPNRRGDNDRGDERDFHFGKESFGHRRADQRESMNVQAPHRRD